MVNYSKNNCNLSIFTSSTIKDAVFPKYSIYIAPCRLFEGGGGGGRDNTAHDILDFLDEAELRLN